MLRSLVGSEMCIRDSSMTQEDIDRLSSQKETIVSSDARLTKRFQEIKDRHVAQTHVTNQCTDTTVSVSKSTKGVVSGWDCVLPSVGDSFDALHLQTDLDQLEDDVDAKYDSLSAVTSHLRNISRLADGSRTLFIKDSDADTPFDIAAQLQKWEEATSADAAFSPLQDDEGPAATTTTTTPSQQQLILNELPIIKALHSIEEGYKLKHAASVSTIADTKSKMEELATKKAALMAMCDAARVSLEERTKTRDDLKDSISAKKKANQEAQVATDTLRASISAKEASLSLGAAEREKRVDELTVLEKEGTQKLAAATESMSIAVTSFDSAEAERQVSLKSLSELEVSRSVWTRRLAQDRRLRSLRHQETEKQHAVVADALKTVSQNTKQRCDAEFEWKKAQQATTDTKSKIASITDTFSKQEDTNRQELAHFINEECIIRNHIELEYNDIATFEKFWFDRIMEEVICCQIREYVTTVSLEELAFSTIIEAQANDLDDLISRMAAQQAAAAAEKFKAEAAERALAEQQEAAAAAAKNTVTKKPTFILKTVSKVDYSDSEDGGISLGREFIMSEDRCYDNSMAPPQRQLGSGGVGGSSQKQPLMPGLLTSQASLLTSQRPNILQSRAGQHAATLPTTPTIANQKGLQSANPAVLTTPSSQQRIRHSFLPPVPKFAAAAAQSSSSSAVAAVPPSSSSGGNVGRAPVAANGGAAAGASSSSSSNVLTAPRRPVVVGKKRAASPTDSYDSYSSLLRPTVRTNKVELTLFEHQMMFGNEDDYEDEEDKKVLRMIDIKHEVRPPPNSYKAPPTPLPGTVGAMHKKVLDDIIREQSVCQIPTEAITGSKSPSPRRPSITHKSHPMLMAVAQVVKNMAGPNPPNVTGRPSGIVPPHPNNNSNKPASATTTTAAAGAAGVTGGGGASRFHLSTTNHGTPTRAPRATTNAVVSSPSSITTPRRQVNTTNISPQHKITNGGSDKRGANNNNNASDFDVLSPLTNTSHSNNNALYSNPSGSSSSKKSAAVLQPPPASPGLSFTQRMLGGTRKHGAAASSSQQLDGGRGSTLLRPQAVNTAVTTPSTKGRGSGGKAAAGTGRRAGIIAPQDENDEFAL
eukprot:TRINITY_DN2322_c0_g2_i1.p1 TRINITY_DN2322_c0_g2~~TRINITY_DN2322_c0_g2_i1.p1  ORF type:complete len:1101 (+),score=298.96 TRINITY_DN2322_c0_g2_i1:134-3436(+)